MNNNPYGVRYGNNPYGAQYVNNPYGSNPIPQLVKLPPPEELRAQTRTQMRQLWDDYGAPLAGYLGSQALEKAALVGATGKSLGDWAVLGGNRALLSSPVQRGITALAATQLGAPIVSQVRSFASSPAGQTTGKIVKTALDWIL